MSLPTVSLINQITQTISTNNEASHRLIQWIDRQDKYNHENNRDIRALDTAIEKVEDEVKDIKEDLGGKRKELEEGKDKQVKVDDLLAKVIAAIAVLEGQVEQQRLLIQQQRTLIDQAQTIATRAIKRARLSTRHSDSEHQDTPGAGSSRVSLTPGRTPTRTLGYPLAQSRAR